MNASKDADFLAAVTSWARDNYTDHGIVVTGVTSYGTDWEGDSENGFHTTFKIDLQGMRGNGLTLWQSVEGEAMDSLWRFVVAGFRPMQRVYDVYKDPQ